MADPTHIEIEDYYDKVHQASWARRTASFLGGATLGVGFGGVIGAAAAFVPYVLGVLAVAGATPVAAPALGAIAYSAALFAGIAGLAGFAAVAVVGADAGAVSAGLMEKERREKLQDRNVAVDSARIHVKEYTEKMPPLFSWKVAVTMVTMFAAFGALLGLTPNAPSSVLMGFEGATATANATPAAVASSAAVFGMFGTLIGFKFSYLTNKVSNFYYKLITGRYFDKSQPEKSTEPQRQEEVTRANEKAIVYAIDLPQPRFAEKEKRFSLRAVIENADQPISRGLPER